MDGEHLYLLESGVLDVFTMTPGSKAAYPGQKVFTFDQPGQSFGELALLHNGPRAATVVAREACTLWRLDRDSFNLLIRDNAMRRRERQTGFLRSVKLLAPLSLIELGSIVDAVVE